MKHIMHLKNDYFNLIDKNLKSIELRIYDQKRRLISVGDNIEFVNSLDAKTSILVEVTNIEIFRSFKDLIEHTDKKLLGWAHLSEDTILDKLREIYSIDDENKFGVVKITFKKIER
ncbi:ASCH domain-containing protein [Paraclostridium sordellii]|uniref:ASCH domain-containing protein n=1 Tax=Paraclostridium sordellii TaxID=1505 RepID=UPI0005E8AF11|nr:ASCH domain-containing protein [Paeniclostridium sordellii]CEN87326.1 ProFAR isomerase associated superfamily [[Clostridium] sordellii] [Paeniclostridium sordellii]CEP40946.1 ProFAR isomerase associated superfamily [[Clostridium] sordellii] [Paeniclostridium sordellii]